MIKTNSKEENKFADEVYRLKMLQVRADILKSRIETIDRHRQGLLQIISQCNETLADKEPEGTGNIFGWNYKESARKSLEISKKDLHTLDYYLDEIHQELKGILRSISGKI